MGVPEDHPEDLMSQQEVTMQVSEGDTSRQVIASSKEASCVYLWCGCVKSWRGTEGQTRYSRQV